MSDARNQLYARFHQHFTYLDCDLEEEEMLLDDLFARDRNDDGVQNLIQHLQEPLDPENPNAFFQRSTNLIGHFQDRRRQVADEWARITHVRELGFRFEPRDLPDACMLMLMFVMDPGEGEDGRQGEDEDEDEDEDEEGEPMPMDIEDEERMPRRWQKPRKLRQPYSVTCALRKTNWFESSMEWENEHFRTVYR
jgi:hypothetical protein